MSGLNPTGPSQPTKDQAYTTAGNPASINPSESATARTQPHGKPFVDHRDPPAGQSAANGWTPQEPSLAQGVHGAPAGEEKAGLTAESLDRLHEFDGDEKMATAAEGKVASAVGKVDGFEKGTGSSGGQIDLASDLDRKKAEQQPYREAKHSQREKNVDVGGILGQRGGPANPTD
ncbi:hypothetical protein BDY21DRAFT_281033 [Lineolata rhizophorae]|uniref:Uncharacterized protein n=1 Tax=Lineolata rhizophorae TaxID=578093 RepID=A0A6A6P7E2_9PEZI|nr:hypothetical protein BDY21DRAFT_281033 [Lineolata rhizophorae]